MDRPSSVFGSTFRPVSEKGGEGGGNEKGEDSEEEVIGGRAALTNVQVLASVLVVAQQDGSRRVLDLVGHVTGVPCHLLLFADLPVVTLFGSGDGRVVDDVFDDLGTREGEERARGGGSGDKGGGEEEGGRNGGCEVEEHC